MRLHFVSNGRFSLRRKQKRFVKFLRILEMQVPNDSYSVILSFQTKNNRVVFLAV